MAATDGYGVDLVLNSLPGPFLEKGLNLLASGGRFLEIGKRDIYADTPIGLRALRKNVSFFAIDLARLAAERPDRLRDELESVLADLGQGLLDPLPVENFPLSQVADAFRHMAKARHIGKIVVSYDASAPQVETIGGVAQIVRPDATYLVTGGLRGFGLATAKWLVDLGVRNLVLVSRSGEAPAEDLDQMRAAGATIVPVAADVAMREGVAKALNAREGARPAAARRHSRRGRHRRCAGRPARARPHPPRVRAESARRVAPARAHAQRIRSTSSFRIRRSLRTSDRWGRRITPGPTARSRRWRSCAGRRGCPR